MKSQSNLTLFGVGVPSGITAWLHECAMQLCLGCITAKGGTKVSL